MASKLSVYLVYGSLQKHKHPCPVKTYTAATQASVNPLTSFFFCYQFCFDRSHTAFTVTHRSGFSNVRIKQARPANSDGALICRFVKLLASNSHSVIKQRSKEPWHMRDALGSQYIQLHGLLSNNPSIRLCNSQWQAADGAYPSCQRARGWVHPTQSPSVI